MSSFCFYHSADIHLDSPLDGLSKYQDRVAELIRSAPRAAFEALVTRTIENEVDFLVIAGDLYDGTWRDLNTGLFFVQQMGRLNEHNIPVFVLHGNHDAESQISTVLPMPENVRVFGAQAAESFRLEEHSVVLHGQSYPVIHVEQNLALGYPERAVGMFNIGVLHTALGNANSGHANYAPCNVSELVAKGYDYWALGHVHTAQVLHENPHIVFPGNIQGRNVRETGAKGASLVTVEDGQVVSVDHHSFDVVRWVVIEVDLTDTESMQDVEFRIGKSLSENVAKTKDRLLLVRLILRGRTEVHNRLMCDTDELEGNVRAIALGMGDSVVWVEKIKVLTRPTKDLAASAAEEETMSDIQQLLNTAANDEEILNQLKRDIGVMLQRLPSDIRESTENELVRLAIDEDYATVIREVQPYLVAQLTLEEI